MSIALSLLCWICTRLIIAGIQMALNFVDHWPSKIIDYLLVDAWDIENSARLQLILWHSLSYASFWYNNWGSRDLDPFFQLSRRISTSGQVIEANLIHDIVETSPFNSISPLEELNYNDLCKFLINQGADIECRYSPHMETALLVAAEVDSIISLRMMPALLWLNADFRAVDYKGRGPLHLALKPSRIYTDVYQRLHFRALKDKLVHLLQAGCSIHAIDLYGRTPTDVARKWRRTKTWRAALQEVGKLACGKSECQCEIIVRLPQALRLSEESFTRVTKD